MYVCILKENQMFLYLSFLNVFSTLSTTKEDLDRTTLDHPRLFNSPKDKMLRKGWQRLF